MTSNFDTKPKSRSRNQLLYLVTDDVAFRSLTRPADQLRKLWTSSDGYGLAMMVFELTRSTANSKLSLQFTDKSFRPAAKTSGHLRVIQSSDETP